MVGVMLLLLPVFLRDTLKLSNRFAGPMYRLRIALQSLAAKQSASPIKFRAGDFWQEATTDFSRICFDGSLELWQHVQNVLDAMRGAAEGLGLDGRLAASHSV